MDWGKIPDLAAVTLLASAFAAVARRSPAPVSTLWRTGWLMIALHFAAFMFAPLPGQVGTVAVYMGITSLAWAGILFNWSSVPDRKNRSSLWMLGIMIGTNTAYLGLIVFNPEATRALTVAAYLFGALPLALALLNIRRENHPLRWTTVACYCALSAFLLKFQNRPGNGLELAINAVLFAIYIGCCIHFWFAYRRATSGAFVTIVGFFAWAAVFVLAPGLQYVLAQFAPRERSLESAKVCGRGRHDSAPP